MYHITIFPGQCLSKNRDNCDMLPLEKKQSKVNYSPSWITKKEYFRLEESKKVMFYTGNDQNNG